MQVYKVLHITTHVGGGVGKVLLNYFSKVKNDPLFYHEVVCLGYTMDDARETIKRIDFPFADHVKKEEIIKMIPDFDIILIHFWNHPLLYDLLVREELPPCRVVIWGHASGFHLPNVHPKKTLTYPDLFVFTSPLTFDTKDVKDLSDEEKKKLSNIWSTGGLEKTRKVKPKKHNGFNIGYLGTVGYSKIHKDFLKICDQIDIPNVKFIVVGGLRHKELEAEAKKLGINEKFEFTGMVEDKTKYFEIFDIFGYPLAPYHYGTCDQVLQETMAAGVVPVVLNNLMETYMIKHNKTGIIAKDIKGYIQAVKDLYNNINWRKELSDNARVYAIEEFSLDSMKKQWDKIFEKLLKLPKTTKKWDIDKKDITAKDVFLEALGHYGEVFKSNEGIIELAKQTIWQVETKGTVHNYSSYFPDDSYLSKWSKLMRKFKK